MDIKLLETKKFVSQRDFEIFEKELQKIISEKKIHKIGEEIFRDIHCLKYQNIETNEIFYLSIPDYAWRGFFLNYKSAKIHIRNIRKLDKEKSLGCIGFLVLIIIVILIRILLK